MSGPPLGRLGALLAIFVVGFGLIFGRLALLQLGDKDRYSAMAENQRVRTIPLPAQRGGILDRSGRHLALSLEAKGIYADQRYIQDPQAAAEALAPLLQLKVPELATQLRGEQSFVYVKRQVDGPIADQVAALDLQGIGFLDESKRYYPAGDMGAPQIVGWVGLEDANPGGLELQYNDTLTGTPGEIQEEVDPAGHQIPQGVQILEPAVPGLDVVTTIDAELQYQAQIALREVVKAENAQGGTLIAMNPRTGEIYAMASYPWFNPNQMEELSQRHLWWTNNPAVQSAFEPGSVNKVITISAALEEKAIDIREKFHVGDSFSKVFSDGTVTVNDSHAHAVETMMVGDIMTESSNVGTLMVAERLGESEMASYLSKFGFGRETGLDFPGETAGLLPPKYAWSGASMLNIPIGQGVSVTPLQMTSVYATVANDGVWVEPTLVTGTTDGDDTLVPAPTPDRRRVISAETAHQVTSMLANVVASDKGTGTLADIPGYWVSGKTGTAQKPKEDGSGYSKEYVASFIGFLPASDPQIVIAAILDDPDSEYGGLAAAPLFQRFGKEAIARLRIPAGDRPDLPPLANR